MAHFVKPGPPRWPNAEIPYTINTNIQSFKNKIISAIGILENSTRVRFKDISVTANNGIKDYVTFTASTRNFSYPGKRVGIQFVELIPDDSKNEFEGAALHEICHVVGLFHEHQRADRDQFVKINANIITTKQSEFSIMPPIVATRLNPYDFKSVSHYPATAYSTNPAQKTIEIIVPANFHFYDVMGQRTSILLKEICRQLKQCMELKIILFFIFIF